jgi:hypothetical protein
MTKLINRHNDSATPQPVHVVAARLGQRSHR